MTEEQIKQMAWYLAHLRKKLEEHYENYDQDMIDHYYTKIETVGDICGLFGCYNEVCVKAIGVEAK